MYYDEFDPSDGVWFSIQNMVKQIEGFDSASEIASLLRHLSDDEIREKRNSYKSILNDFSQVVYQLMSNRHVSDRISSLYDRAQSAESKLRSIVSLLEKPVDRRTDEERKADEKKEREAAKKKETVDAYNRASGKMMQLATWRASTFEELETLTNSYAQLIEAFQELGDYKYSKKKMALCEAKLNELNIKYLPLKEEREKKANTLREKIATYRGCISSCNASYAVGLQTNGTLIIAGERYNASGLNGITKWRDIVEVSVGAYHALGLKMDGTVAANGSNSCKQCNVSTWKNITAIACGYEHSVGLKSDRTVIASGRNEFGECDVSEWKDIIQIAAPCCSATRRKRLGGSEVPVGAIDTRTVALKSNGTVVATGENESGSCNIYAWEDIVSVSTGSLHTVGLKANGTVVSTGDNLRGQCDVSSWSSIVAIAAGEDVTVGLKSDGTVVVTGFCEKGFYEKRNASNWCDIVAINASSKILALKSNGKVVAFNADDANNWQNIGPPNIENLLQRNRRREQGLCPSCGGKIGGFFTKRCKSCDEVVK